MLFVRKALCVYLVYHTARHVIRLQNIWKEIKTQCYFLWPSNNIDHSPGGNKCGGRSGWSGGGGPGPGGTPSG